VLLNWWGYNFCTDPLMLCNHKLLLLFTVLLLLLVVVLGEGGHPHLIYTKQSLLLLSTAKHAESPLASLRPIFAFGQCITSGQAASS
jgi:hypothetical protein